LDKRAMLHADERARYGPREKTPETGGKKREGPSGILMEKKKGGEHLQTQQGNRWLKLTVTVKPRISGKGA